jgi:class 3 adenylate cyclase
VHISAFLSSCASEVNRFGGVVSNYLGDGALAYFRYPAAHVAKSAVSMIPIGIMRGGNKLTG